VFDERFAVRSSRPEQLEALLGPRVRREMLALDAFLPVELHGRGISGSGRLSGTVEPAELARQILDLAAALDAA
jgi:hypothetical protein